MDVTFDSGNRDRPTAKTRIYAPTHPSAGGQPIPISPDGEQLPQPQPRPSEQNPQGVLAPEQPRAMTMQSKILLLITIFLVAVTILFGLRGSAQIARLYADIYRLDSEIATYEEEISQIRKEQGATSGYIAIRDTNQEAGRILNWGTE